MGGVTSAVDLDAPLRNALVSGNQQPDADVTLGASGKAPMERSG